MIYHHKTNTMKKIAKGIITILGLGFILNFTSEISDNNVIKKNGMKVTWKYKNDRIHFTMSAPTKGWVAIGFNSQSGTKGTYLIMGKVENKKSTVTEYYTLSPGNYKPINVLGDSIEVKDVSGSEKKKFTQLKFSLPISSLSKYKRDLSKGKSYYLLLAFSESDDFEHHSRMRTEMKINL